MHHHHPILAFLLIAFIVSRIVWRLRMRRAWLRGFGCAPWGRHHHCHRRRWRGFGGPGFHHFRDGGTDFNDGAADFDDFGRFAQAPRQRRSPDELRAALELNLRQKQLFDEVVTGLGRALPQSLIGDVLGVMAREPFARAELADAVGEGELLDDLEQLHHSLTPEQRATLRTESSSTRARA